MSDALDLFAGLPEAAFAETQSVLGMIGTGKTFTIKGEVEFLLRLRRRVCIIDPTGAWWGLRLLADGKTPAFKIAVLGGDHGDFDLEADSGAKIGEIVATQNFPLVLDLSNMIQADQLRFMLAFEKTLYHLNRTALHLIFDEADEFAPQSAMAEQRHVLHQTDRIVRRGRIKGFRVTTISQRAACLHKNILTQSKTLILHALSAAQDQAAARDWLNANIPDRSKEIMDSLAGLQLGEAWFLCPKYGIAERLQFPRITTFDSSRTPEHDEDPIEVAERSPFTFDDLARALDEVKAAAPVTSIATLAPGKAAGKVDGGLTSLDRMIEGRALRWDKHTTSLTISTPDGRDDSWVKRIFLGDDEYVTRTEVDAQYRHGKVHGYSAGVVDGWDHCAKQVGDRLRDATEEPESIAEHRKAVAVKDEARATDLQTRPLSLAVVEDERTTRQAFPAKSFRITEERPVAQKVLDGLAEMEAMGVPEASRPMLAFLAGYTSTDTKSFKAALSEQAAAGLLSYPSDGLVALTDKGRRKAAKPEVLAGPELRERIAGMLGGASGRIITKLTAIYPKSITRDALAAHAGYTSIDTKSFKEAVARLRALTFIAFPKDGEIAATALLFPERKA